MGECPSVSCVDIQHNKISEDVSIVEVLEQMPNLKVLYLQGNDVIKKIKWYRKSMITRCKNLKYLDDRPVFPDERLRAVAWCKGWDQQRKKRKNCHRSTSTSFLGRSLCQKRRSTFSLVNQSYLPAKVTQFGMPGKQGGAPLSVKNQRQSTQMLILPQLSEKSATE